MSKITGKSIHSSIQLRADGYSGEVRQAQRDLNSVRSQIGALVESQEQQLLSIGKAHLAEVIARRVQGCTPGLHKLYQQREAMISIAEDGVKQASEEGESLRIRAEGAEQAYAEARAELQEILESSPELNAAKKEAQEAGQRSDADRRSSEAALSESWNKLSGYNSSAAFMHLLNRNFGTPEYAGSLLFAWGDRWLAGKINFTEAKGSYQYLQGLAESSKELAKKSLKAKEAADSKVNLIKMELEAASNVSSAKVARDKAGASLDLNAARLQELERRIGEFRRLRDSQYTEMLELLKATLKGMSHEELRIFVTATPSTEDDAALRSLLSARQTAHALQAKEAELAHEVVNLQARHDQAKKLVRHFEQEDFDGKRRIYSSDFDVDALVTGYVLGSINQSMIDNLVRSNSVVEPEPQPYTPPPSYSPPISSSSGSSFSNDRDDDDDEQRRRSSGGFSNTDVISGSSGGYTNEDKF